MRATPTVIGRPTCSSTSRRSRAAISIGVPDTRRSPPTSRNASSIDRPSTSGVVSLEHLEHGLAGLGVGRHPGRHDDGVRAQPPGLAPAHGRAHPERLGLVARGQHDAAADDHRPAAQRAGRRAARPTRRTSRGRRAGSSPRLVTNTCSHTRPTMRRLEPGVGRDDTGPVGNLVLAVVAMLLPTLVALAVIAVIRLGRLVARRRTPVVATDLPIERIAATARRLRAEEAELRSDYRGPGRQVRIAAAVSRLRRRAGRRLPRARGPTSSVQRGRPTDRWRARPGRIGAGRPWPRHPTDRRGVDDALSG